MQKRRDLEDLNNSFNTFCFPDVDEMSGPVIGTFRLYSFSVNLTLRRVLIKLCARIPSVFY